MDAQKPYEQLLAENRELQYQLAEAKDTIDAIRNGQVDALVVKGKKGHQLFTLKNADQTYRVFIEKMAEGAVTINREGIILYSNSRFAKLIGIPLEKVIGESFALFVDDSNSKEYEKLVRNGWKEDCKGEIMFSDTVTNKPIPCLLSCNILELDEGLALSIIITDLTSQREIQSQLKLKNEQLEEARSITEKLNDELEVSVKERTLELFDSREHFKSLADNVPQMIWTSLPDGTVNFRSRQWYEFTGLDVSEPLENIRGLISHPEDIEENNRRFTAALKTKQPFMMESRVKRKDGTYRWHLNRAVPMRNETGEITLWIGTSTDIDDQKREMEKKDEFIGIASHELKTPLTSLKGYLQLISGYKKEPLPAPVKMFVNKANEALGKLQYLVNDLLDVSKINAGKLQYQMLVIDLAELVESCINNARHIYPKYDIKNEGGAKMLVMGNMERLEQVMMNLVSNSVKYSKENKQIIISTTTSGNMAKVVVTDFGIGLSESQQNKIFERFYRVEDKKFMSSGLGMGLYICAEIIKDHNGIIGVNSELGKGASFYFELPLV
ncbi:PAS domain S-box protein [Mucilaginibacter sp. HMF5004]|uniref:PAS domain-containing sensor histidine kinase n=1 Tax=Mucilaginibacter rivuli TaxID=2857527 RepID=UPI001C5F35A4|nr:PAS domain S-box protein [Mucilaginibacter rivuli]MBW4889341.1 PAS domain S-box protein [Mucilaginibacter rivuli]